MSNKARARNGQPFDFVDGIKIKGIDLSSNSGELQIGSDDNASGNLWSTIKGFIGYLRSSLGASIVGYMPAGAGAAATDVQSKLRESINVLDFYANGVSGVKVDPTGVTDSTLGIQAAINYALSINKNVIIPAGVYKTTASLNLIKTTCLFGDGVYASTINYYGTESAILCSNYTGTISGLAIEVFTATANGIEIGRTSRFPVLRNVYVSFTKADNLGFTPTGAGFFLNAVAGWSSAASLENCYSLQFKYGLRVEAPNSSESWTGISITNCWFLGNFESGAPRPDTYGIYMGATCNGHATVMNTGMIQACDYGCYFADGQEGAQIRAHFESNNHTYYAGNTFNGSIVNDLGQRLFKETVGTTLAIQRTESGGVITEETRYPRINVISEGSVPRSIKYYVGNNSISQTDGTFTAPTNPNSLKFAIGIGPSSTYGILVHPSFHYIQLADKKISWGATSPADRLGDQVVAWSAGDICYNSLDSTSLSIGWRCTVSGTPGTWKRIGTQSGINTLGDADVTISVNSYYPTSIFSTPLSVDRTITLSTTGALSGDKLRITRTSGSSGAYILNVGGLKTLATGSWCDVEYNGSVWILTAYGTL